MQTNPSPRTSAALILLVLFFFFFMSGFMGGYLFTFSVPFIWMVIIQGRPWSDLGLTRKNLKRSLLWGFVSGVFLVLTCLMIFKVLHIPKVSLSVRVAVVGERLGRFSLRSIDGDMLLKSFTPKGLWVFWAYMMFGVGLGEEIFWRGFMQHKLSQRMTEQQSLLTTSFMFMSIHFYLLFLLPLKYGLIFLGMIGIAGYTWGVLFNRFHNVWGVALSHGLTAFITWRFIFYSL